jgi:hypothetical protein
MQSYSPYFTYFRHHINEWVLRCFQQLRASTIELTQLAIRTKIVYLCLVGGERRGVGSNARASSSTCS